MKAKTQTRLIILVAVVAACSVGGVGFIAYRKHVNTVNNDMWRAQGKAAFEAMDYATAIDLLGKYAPTHDKDVEVLYMMARARLRLEDPEGKHLPVAAKWFRKVVDLDPSNEDAQRSLLKIYRLIGARPETISLANDMLKNHPKDVDLLRTRALAEISMGKLDDAQKTSEQIIDLAPLDIEAHHVLFDILEKAPARLPRIIAAVPAEQRPTGLPDTYRLYAKLILAAHPDTAQSEMIASMALLYARDMKDAQAHAVKASQLPIADHDVLVQVVRQLDLLGKFDESVKLLEARAATEKTLEARRDWVLRLVYLNRFKDVLQVLSTMDDKAPDADADLMAARAYSLFRMDHNEDALAVISVMEAKGPQNARAVAMGRVLHASVLDAGDKEIVAQRLDTIRNTVRASLYDSPIAWQLLGNADSRRGNRDAALDDWSRAALGAPGWAEPFIHLSQEAMAMSRFDQASNYALLAEQRLPNDKDVMITYARAWSGYIAPLDTRAAQKFMAYLDKIEAISPMDPQIVPIRIYWLGLLNRKDEAVALARKAIDTHPPLSENAFIRLALQCRISDIPLVDECLAASEKAHGLTPELALVKANWLRLQGNPSEGLANLDKATKEHPGNAQWQSAWAHYLDTISDPRARQAWIDLAAANPEDSNIQWDALNSIALAKEMIIRDAILRRLEEQSKDKDHEYVDLYRARWLMDNVNLTAEGRPATIEQQIKTLQNAEQLLKNVLKKNGGNGDARVRHALCLEALDKLQNPNKPPQLQEAIEDVKIAVSQFPSNALWTLEYARLLARQGDMQRVAEVVRPVLTPDYKATPEQKRTAASLLIQAGKNDEALAALKLLPDSNDGAQYRMEARLYRQRGEFDKVEPLVGKMLQVPDLAGVQFAADYYASTGRMELARTTLNIVDKLDLPQAIRELVRAAFARNHGDPKDAEAHTLEAIRLDPTNAAARRQLVVIRVLQGDDKGAREAIMTAAQEIRTDLVLKTAAQQENLDELIPFVRVEGLQSLVASVMEDPAESAGSMEAIHVLSESDKTKEKLGDTAPKIGKIAHDHPRNLPVQMIAIQLYARCGRLADARIVADQAMEAFPTSPEPAQVAANTLAALKQWEDVIPRAKEWKKRAPNQAILADTRIADAYINWGKAPEALATLQPYLAAAKADPKQNAQIILLYARALLVSNQYDDARALLRPLIHHPANEDGMEWVDIALHLIVEGVSDEKVAEAWMNELDPVIADGTLERARFAQAWYNLSDRYRNLEFSKRSRDMLEKIAQNDQVPSNVITTLGMDYEVLGDVKNAELMYVRSLKMNPNEALAANNLAMIYVNRGDKLPDALKWMDMAVKVMPNFPAFHDTRAMVLARQGDIKGAVAEAQISVRLDSGNPEWWLTLLDLQCRSSDDTTRRAARDTLAELDARARSTLTDTQVKRLDALRKNMPKF